MYGLLSPKACQTASIIFADGSTPTRAAPPDFNLLKCNHPLEGNIIYTNIGQLVARPLFTCCPLPTCCNEQQMSFSCDHSRAQL